MFLDIDFCYFLFGDVIIKVAYYSSNVEGELKISITSIDNCSIAVMCCNPRVVPTNVYFRARTVESVFAIKADRIGY